MHLLICGFLILVITTKLLLCNTTWLAIWCIWAARVMINTAFISLFDSEARYGNYLFTNTGIEKSQMEKRQ